jgi:hypothetical protein
MDFVAWGVHGVLGIITLVCFILVVMQMFQHGQAGLGIACIVLIFCVGIGGLIAFIYGWIRARDWNITNIMAIWTIVIVVDIVMNFVMPIQIKFGQ